MKYIKLLFLSECIAFCSFTSAHKHYLSLTQIDYIENSKSLQITSEIFIDDLEMVLKERYDGEIVLDELNAADSTKNYVKKYLEDKFNIWINGNKIKLEFLGFEYEQDKIVCYLEGVNIPEISTFEVTNSILFELFPEQKNVVKLKVNDLEKSFLLIKDKSKEHFEIK